MTYLLTEIALGILGHKFYDVDGVRRNPSLHENSLAKVDELAAESFAGELLEIDENPTSSSNAGPKRDLVNCVEQTPDAEDNDNIIDESDNDSMPTQEITMEMCENGLQKIMSIERDKLREQIKKHQYQYAAELIKSNVDVDTINIRYKEAHWDMLWKQSVMLKRKRKDVERELSAMDWEKYNKYVRTFRETMWTDSTVKDVHS